MWRSCRSRGLFRGGAAALLVALALLPRAPAAESPVQFDAASLAAQLRREPVVLLGEQHDNVAQHALRVAALRILLEGGARPAIAFEQFDRGAQADIDRLRAGPDGTLAERARRLIDAAGGRGWDWRLYQPYVALALEFELPIVAANLSRDDAMRVALGDFGAVFDDRQRSALGLDHLPEALLQAQEHLMEEGHCHRLPADALPGMARAQVARDATLAASIEPYAGRGVVLLTGNGHARRDLGVIRYLAPAVRAHSLSIGLIEEGGDPHEEQEFPAGSFDAILITPRQQRPDPCEGIRAPSRPRKMPSTPLQEAGPGSITS